MGVNKVVYGGNTLIDLSADTVAANKMLAGITGHDKAGNPITGNIPSQAAQTITPGTADKTIAAGKYLSGKQTIKGDANLKAANIAKGVSIFGVTGTHEGGEDVSAETAEYTELLTDLEAAVDALPDAGSGGGASIGTCTVSVTNQSGTYMQIFYTAYSNGIYDDGYMYNSGALTNVMCNTVILIEITTNVAPTVQVSEDVELLGIIPMIYSGFFILLMSNSSNGGDVIISSSAGGGYD